MPSSKLTEPKMLTTEELTSKSGIDQAGYEGIRITTMGLKDRLPPLDVLMVWHAYLLNPRCFFEDCFRYQKLDFFATPFPFEAIDGCIDVVSFEFRGTDAAQNRFVSTTGFYWDNLNDSLTTPIQCGGCGTINEVLWTTDSQWRSFMDEMSKGNGLADAKFWHNCTSCRLRIDHDHLRVNKFLNDAGLCYFKDVPLPGTLLNPDGMPEEAQKHINLGKPYNNFPNLLIKAGLVDVMREVDGVGTTSWRMEKIRDGFEDALKNKKFIRKAKIGSTVIGRERNAVRKVMSRYWYNSSPFALDLAGAVIRQGSFIDKMHDIDWLHSPALKGTMKRLIEKYSRFFQIMTNNKYNMAVPTLDVDLAWHTHQLNAADYYRFSIAYASKYIDHDDKVEEVALSDAFTWTSQKYADMFGEPYSECRCWYCEAVREASSSRLDGLFKPKKKEAKAKLHESEDIATDPLKSAHISAHNAVRDLDGEAKAAVHAAKLDKAYNKAAAKAKKKGQVPPSRDQYYAAYYWGYPMPMPIYYPYAVPVGVGGDCHASDPCAYNSAPGSYGACAAGSCGGMAAAGGSCGGGSGGACGSGGKQEYPKFAGRRVTVLSSAIGGGCGSGGGGGGCGKSYVIVLI